MTAGAPSNEQMEAVLRKARSSFAWFCVTMWQIKDPDGGIVRFDPNPPQLRLIALIERLVSEGKPVKIIILKARQMGFSTVCQAYLAWRSFCFKGQSCLTVAHLEEPSGELFSKIEFGWENLPDWFRPERDGRTRGKRLQLGRSHNNALLYVDHAKNKHAGRSQTFQAAHFSEVAFWDDAKTIFTAMKPALRRAKYQFVESTANGVGGYFYDLWKGAEYGEGHPDWNGWHAFFAPWFELPDYGADRVRTSLDVPLSADEREYMKMYGLSDAQMLWRRDTLADMDEEKFRQEYPSNAHEAFVTSGSGFFTPKSLDYHREKIVDPVRKGQFAVSKGEHRAKFHDEPHGPVWIWERPVEDGRYVVSADIASGGARDFTAIHVLRVGETLEQVAAYRGKCDPDEAAVLISRLAKVYSPGRGVNRTWALVAPERNVIGMQTVAKLRDVLHYPNIYTHRHVDTVDYRESREYGWLTTPKSRIGALEYLKELVREDGIRIRCARTFAEMETFIYDENDKPVAPRGGFDDMVMALAIGAAVSERMPVGPAVMYQPSGAGDFDY